MDSSGHRPDVQPRMHDGVEYLAFVDVPGGVGGVVEALILLADNGLFRRWWGRWNAEDHAALDDMLETSSPVRVADTVVEAFDAAEPMPLSWDEVMRHALDPEVEEAVVPVRTEPGEVGEVTAVSNTADIWSILLGDGGSTEAVTDDLAGGDTEELDNGDTEELDNGETDEADDSVRSIEDDEMLRMWVPDADRAINSATSIVGDLTEYLCRRRALEVEELDLFGELRALCTTATIETIAAAASFLQAKVFRYTDSAVISGKSPTEVAEVNAVDALAEGCLDPDDLEQYVRDTEPERGILARRIWERLRYDAVLAVLAHDEGDEDVEPVLMAAFDGFLAAGLGDEASRAAQTLLEVGVNWIGSGDFTEAMSAIEHARSGFELLDAPERVANCVLALIDAYMEAGWEYEAEDALAEAVTTYAEWTGDDRLADCVRRLGLRRLRSGRFEESEQLLLQARALFESVEAVTSVADCDRDLSTVYEAMGLYADAEIAALGARDAYTASGNADQAADAERNLGVLYQTMGRFDESEKAFKRALVTCESRKVEERTAQQHFDLGVLYTHLGRFDHAEESFLLARQLFSERELDLSPGYNLDVAECDLNLGGVYLDLFRGEDATLVLVSAREVFERIGGQESKVTDCNVRLGDAFRELGQFEQSEAWFVAARDGYRLLGELELEATCMVSLGGLRSAMGDSSGAEQLYLTAREVFSNLGAREQAADVDVRLGLEYVRADLPAAARRAFRRARETFAVLGLSARASDCTRQLAMVRGAADLDGFRSPDDELTALLSGLGGDDQ